MNFKESKILLDKINRLFEGMQQSPQHVSSIEKDLMLNYIRNLYEQFYMEKHSTEKKQMSTVSSNIVAQTPKTAVKQEPKPVVQSFTPPSLPVTQPVSPRPQEEKKDDYVAFYAQNIVKSTARVEEVKTTPKVEEIQVKQPVVQQPPVKKQEIKKPTLPPTPTPPLAPEIDTESEMLFESKKATDLSEKLGLTPILDLNKAFGLNDRMLYTNELFGGNNNIYRETMEILNSCNSFEQAKIYLIENVANRFNWTSKDKKKLAKDFIKTINRKYV